MSSSYIPPVTTGKVLKAYVLSVKPERRYGQYETTVLFGRFDRKYLKRERRTVFVSEFPKVGSIISVQVFD